jgi:hypothetical protein
MDRVGKHAKIMLVVVAVFGNYKGHEALPPHHQLCTQLVDREFTFSPCRIQGKVTGNQSSLHVTHTKESKLSAAKTTEQRATDQDLSVVSRIQQYAMSLKP